MPIIPSVLETLKSLGLLNEIYTDIAKPGVTQAGKAIGAIIGLGNTALWPIHLLNEKAKLYLDANLEQYRMKLASVNQEKIVEVPPEIGIPILERFSYISNAKLRELYCNLLAKASTQDTQGLAHPSFATILNNITPDEALLLSYIKRHYRIEFDLINENGIKSISFKVQVTQGLTFPTNLSAYVSNLEGLGIVKISDSSIVTPPLDLSENYNDIGYVTVTEFGQMFLKACVSD